MFNLMHKDIPVAEIRLDSATESVSAVGEILTPSHVPVGIPVKKGKIDRAGLNEWWRGRAIPTSIGSVLPAGKWQGAMSIFLIIHTIPRTAG